MKTYKIAVALFGSPGSGKGTQADLLAERYGLVHLDTGKLIEKAVHDPARQDDPIIIRERKNFDTGLLTTPEWFVEEIIIKEIRENGVKGQGIIFSGSPRTLFEVEQMLPALETYYSRGGLLFLRIVVKDETAIFRNIHRRICSVCRTPVIYTEETKDLQVCPKCGGKLVTRTLDTHEAMAVRLNEYRTRTEPVFEYLKEHEYQITDVNGEPDPDTVTKEIFEKVSEMLG